MSKKKYSKTSADETLRLGYLLKEGYSVKEIAILMKMTVNRIYSIIKKCTVIENGKEVFDPLKTVRKKNKKQKKIVEKEKEILRIRISAKERKKNRRKRAVELIKSGMPVVQVAEELSVAPTTVYNWINTEGAGEFLQNKYLTEEDKKEIISQRIAGIPAIETAKVFGCTEESVYRIFRDYEKEKGIVERRNAPLTKEQEEHIERLIIDKNLSVKEVMEATGLSESTIYRRRRKLKQEE